MNKKTFVLINGKLYKIALGIFNNIIEKQLIVQKYCNLIEVTTDALSRAKATELFLTKNAEYKALLLEVENSHEYVVEIASISSFSNNDMEEV
jgi:hypothetical protein